jgi:type II secretory pathway component PulC
LFGQGHFQTPMSELEQVAWNKASRDTFFLLVFLSLFNHIKTMTTAYRRSAKVVTDSEDDQSDSRQRRDLHITSKHATNDENKEKVAAASFGPYHTIPIHTITKPSVLSKEAPPENYSGFIRLGSKCIEAR